MGPYRPRPSESRRCQHCGNSFLSSHKRTQYCGESCRQLAYQARRKAQQPSAQPDSAAGQLRFSVQNVGVTTAGSAFVALTNYLVNDRPAQQAVLAQLTQLTQRVDQLTRPCKRAVCLYLVIQPLLARPQLSRSYPRR